VVGLPDRVAMRRLIAQVQAVLAAARLAATSRRALAGDRSRANAACSVRNGGDATPRWRVSRQTAAPLPPRRR